MPAITPTKRLYFDDAYLCNFAARVVAMMEFRGQPAVVLDATALYPEGGGQPADMGSLGGVVVRDVQEEDDIIYHILAATLPASVGDTVTGAVAWQRRFDFMQQHTGQHTLSGACYRLLNAPTLSWHLGADAVTIDIGRAGLSDDAIAEIEHMANEILWQDVAVTAQIYSRAELARLTIRKGSDRDGDIRVVSIGDFDRIGCGGTHVAATGQVGAIGVRRWETHGQLTRIEFGCGSRALADHHTKTVTLNAAGATLSAKPDEIMPQIERLMAQAEAQRKEIADLRQQLVDYVAQELLAQAHDTCGNAPIVCARRDGSTMHELRLLAQRIAERGGIGLIGGVVGDKAQLAFASDKHLSLDLNQALKSVLPLIEGKGGGQKFQAQGGGAHLAGLDAALAKAYTTLLTA